MKKMSRKKTLANEADGKTRSKMKKKVVMEEQCIRSSWLNARWNPDLLRTSESCDEYYPHLRLHLLLDEG